MTELQPYTPAASTDLATTDTWVPVLQDVAYLASRIADTDFVPSAYKGNNAAVAASILYGRELGLPPMTALKAIDPIKGTPSLSSEAMRALILAAGHKLRFVESTATRCVMEGRRRDEEAWTRVAYTMDEAKSSGDANKNPQYRSRPAEMMVARCTSRIARMMFADCIGGFPSPEEVEAVELAEIAPETAPKRVTIERESEQNSHEIAPKTEPKRAPIAPKTRRKAAPKPTPEPAQIEAVQDGPPLPGEDGFEEMIAPPIEDEQPTEPLRTEAQSKKLFACLRSLGIGSRDEGLEMIASILGHPIESTKELTKSQAAKVIDALESMEEPIEAEVVDE